MLCKLVTIVSALAASTAFAMPLVVPSASTSDSEYEIEAAITKRDTLTPVMNGQNFPDPAVIKVGNSWYGFATNGKVNGKLIHVQMAHTSDFKNWIYDSGVDALPNLPSWVDPDKPRVWAPDVVQLDNGNFVMYYTAATAANKGLHCVGRATSTTVQGPYTPVPGESEKGWICDISKGGAIDPAGYKGPQGKRWVTYKVDGNAIGYGGTCGNQPTSGPNAGKVIPTPIMLQQVDADGIHLIGSPKQLITNDQNDGPVTEAPSLSQMHDGTFVLFFSSNCYSTPLYDVSYATSKNIEGPYNKYGPLLVTGNHGLTAPGGLDLAVNGNHAVFHANYGSGRAMFTALISGKGNSWTANVHF